MQHLQRLHWFQRHFGRKNFWRDDKGAGGPLWRHCLLLFGILLLEVLEVLEMQRFKAFAKSPVGCPPPAVGLEVLDGAGGWQAKLRRSRKLPSLPSALVLK